MPSVRHWFPMFCAGFLASTPALAEPADAVSAATIQPHASRPFRIALIELSDIHRIKSLTQRTLPKLKQAFLPYPIEVQTLSSQALEEAVRNRTVDAFIASSGFYWRMIPYGARDVATMISVRRPDPNHASAITFITKRNNTLLNTIADLQGLRLSASYPTAFMGYRIGLAEIAAEGFDPEHFFASVSFTNSPVIDAIAEKVLTGEADAAFVQSCWLESQPPDVRKKFRVVAPLDDDVLPCAHSTAAYPNITVAVLPHAAPEAAREMARVLLNMPEDEEGQRWGLATNFQAVDRVYRLLKLENYAYLREWSVKRWIDAHKHWIAAGVFCLVFLILYSFIVSRMVRLRTRELVRTTAEKEAGERRLAALYARMENIRKASIMSQLSNLIAHELAQPVGAARSFCDGLKLLKENGRLTPAKLDASLKGLDHGLRRIQKIVEKVRSYSKGDVARDQRLKLAGVIQTARDSISKLASEGVTVTITLDEAITVLGDQLEMELLLNNLLSNAVAAARKATPSEVAVTAAGDSEHVVVLIENSGVPLTDEDLAQLAIPFVSVSGPGHGLGVPISLSLAEANGGHLSFEKRTGGGLRAILVLRRALAEAAPSV